MDVAITVFLTNVRIITDVEPYILWLYRLVVLKR